MSHPSTSNQFCSQCQLQACTSFCKCQGSLFFLCLPCLSSHYQKFPFLSHQFFPIEARYTDEARFQQTCELYAKGKKEIQRSIGEIERCSRELTETVNRVVAGLERYREEAVARLRELKEGLEREASAAMEEVEKTLSPDNPTLKSDLAKGLRHYQPGSLPGFTYAISEESLEKAVENLFIYTVIPAEIDEKQDTPGQSIYAGNGPVVPYVQNDKVLFYDCSKQIFSSVLLLQRELKVIQYFAYALIGSQCVICCGGLSSSQAPTETVFSIEAEGLVTQLAGLQYARYLHGIIYVPELKTIFLFGGLRGSSATVTETPLCEGLDLAAEQVVWVRLPNMSVGRKRFNPCWHLRRIYLCGSPNPILEFFDPADLTMTVLPFRLQEQPSACITYVHNGLLMVISDCYVHTYEGSGTTFTARNIETHRRVVPIPSAISVVAGGIVYIASGKGVVGLNAESGEQVISHPN